MKLPEFLCLSQLTINKTMPIPNLNLNTVNRRNKNLPLFHGNENVWVEWTKKSIINGPQRTLQCLMAVVLSVRKLSGSLNMMCCGYKLT